MVPQVLSLSKYVRLSSKVTFPIPETAQERSGFSEFQMERIICESSGTERKGCRAERSVLTAHTPAWHFKGKYKDFYNDFGKTSGSEWEDHSSFETRLILCAIPNAENTTESIAEALQLEPGGFLVWQKHLATFRPPYHLLTPFPATHKQRHSWEPMCLVPGAKFLLLMDLLCYSELLFRNCTDSSGYIGMLMLIRSKKHTRG